MSRYSTMIAIALGIGLVTLAAGLATGSIAFLWNPEAIAIVVGGSLIAAAAGSTPRHLAETIKLLPALISRQPNAMSIAQWWIATNTAWRREGISALQQFIGTAPSPSAATILQFCADGFDPDEIARLTEQLLTTTAERYQRAIVFFRRIAGYAPTMGIVGTVIGLASALASGGDSATLLLQRIGFAFSATLWGLVTANFLWLPIAQRFESMLQEQRTIDRLHVEAARLVASGSTPLLTRYRLATLLPDTQQQQLLDHDATISSSAVVGSVTHQ